MSEFESPKLKTAGKLKSMALAWCILMKNIVQMWRIIEEVLVAMDNARERELVNLYCNYQLPREYDYLKKRVCWVFYVYRNSLL